MDDRSPVSDRLRHVASRFEASVSHGRAEQLAARAVARAQRVPRRHHRVAAAVVGSAFTIVVLSGLAVAAESAVPGDLLYPVDRAVEALGLDRNLLEERLEEAIVLADRGDRDRVVVIAGEVLDEVNRSGVQVVRTPPTLVAVIPEAEELDAGEVDQAVSATTNPGTVGSAETAPTTAAPADQSTGEVRAVQDPVAMIRLEAENLLRTVRQAKSDPTALDAMGLAAGSLADAIDAAAMSPSTTTSTTTTAPVVSSSTTTSTTTSSTSPTSSTTSTTVEGDGGGDDGSEPGDGDGSGSGNEQPPITLPQP